MIRMLCHALDRRQACTMQFQLCTDDESLNRLFNHTLKSMVSYIWYLFWCALSWTWPSLCLYVSSCSLKVVSVARLWYRNTVTWLDRRNSCRRSTILCQLEIVLFNQVKYQYIRKVGHRVIFLSLSLNICALQIVVVLIMQETRAYLLSYSLKGKMELKDYLHMSS